MKHVKLQHEDGALMDLLFAAALCVLIPLVGWTVVLVVYLAWTYGV